VLSINFLQGFRIFSFRRRVVSHFVLYAIVPYQELERREVATVCEGFWMQFGVKVHAPVVFVPPSRKLSRVVRLKLGKKGPNKQEKLGSQKGEEVTICYIDANLPRPARQEVLLRQFYFTCSCVRYVFWY
jgi:hypothetical protein